MFGLEWSKNNNNINEIDKVLYSRDTVSKIDRIVPLMWGEHCLECAIPECYSTCPKFNPRDDRRCKRFKNGIEKIENGYGVWGYTVKISFEEWGKLEAIFLPHTLPFTQAKKYQKVFDITTSIAKALPTYYPRRLNYLYKEYITRKIGNKNDHHPEMLIAEFINTGDEYKLILETKTDEKMRFRRSWIVRPGFNRFEVPFYQLNYEEGFKNYICLYPDNDAEVDVYICALDLVTMKEKAYVVGNMADKEAKRETSDLPKIKCVIWDLDNTMWKGILSEDDDVTLNLASFDVVRELDRRGILNSIASKNDHDETIKKLKEFGIAEYFLCPQINWGMKSDSIKKIADILDIGIDTFAFVDDMEYERGEVATALPMVRTFDAAKLDELMASDGVNVPITEASALRRSSYVDIAKRNSDLANYMGDLAGFVKTCDIKVEIHAPTKSEYLRCAELIQRTNQLNLSGVRLTIDELIELFNREYILAQAIRVHDRYGDYGLVGVAIYMLEKEKSNATLKHFVLSCRAARKLVEQSYFEYMIKYFNGLGYQTVTFDCAVTAKNSLLRKSIKDICDNVVQIDDKHYRMSVKCEFYEPKYSDFMEFTYDRLHGNEGDTK